MHAISAHVCVTVGPCVCVCLVSWRIAAPMQQCSSIVSSGPASKYVTGLIIRPAYDLDLVTGTQPHTAVFCWMMNYYCYYYIIINNIIIYYYYYSLLSLVALTLSLPTPLRLYCLPYWSNPSFSISDSRALWRSRLSARVPDCQKLKVMG